LTRSGQPARLCKQVLQRSRIRTHPGWGSSNVLSRLDGALHRSLHNDLEVEICEGAFRSDLLSASTCGHLRLPLDGGARYSDAVCGNVSRGAATGAKPRDPGAAALWLRAAWPGQVARIAQRATGLCWARLSPAAPATSPEPLGPTNCDHEKA